MKRSLITAALVIGAASVQAETRQLLWGDTHLHTTYSSDAFANNNLTATPDTAYRFAKGQPVLHPYNGMRVQLETPLDFLVVSDHSEFLGVIRSSYLNGIDRSGLGFTDSVKAWFAEYILKDAVGRREARLLFADILPESEDDIVEAARHWAPEVGGVPPQEPVQADTWKIITDTADAHNQPGEFTALIGWEYSLTPGGANLHRVVLGDLDASQAQTFSPFGFDDSVYPEDLWAWMEKTSTATGGNLIAIPHNSNLSKGAMFAEQTLRGEAISVDYAERRSRWEPITEITQIKGDSETHPTLSPDDPFADFETYPYYLQRSPEEYRPKVGDYIRASLRRGLEIEHRVGANPYQFGVIGSTDAHTALSSAEENNFQGKMATDSIPANKQTHWGDNANGTFGWAMSAQGLAAVWASENSRAAIVDAMRRREVYATTGPRIGVRVYAGLGLLASDLDDPSFPDNIMAKAVPMGGALQAEDLTEADSVAAPTLLIEATADPKSAALDRIQVVKGWLEADGSSQEQVFDVAWFGEGRLNEDGSLKPVPDTVDRSTGHWDNTSGAARLTAAWQDPQFSAEQSAFYYVRVLQIPTPRHSLYDKIALDQEGTDTHRPDVLQERAYTSAIWYRP